MRGWIERRKVLVAWCLLVLAGALVYLAVDRLVVERYREYEKEASRLSEQLRRLQGLVARRPLLEKRLEQAKRAQPAQGDYLTQATEALAAAELQERVKTALESAGGKLVSTQNMPVQRNERYPRVTIKVRATGSVESAQKLFHSLESGKPLAFLDNVVIQARTIRRPIVRRGVPQSPNLGLDTELDISFDLSGYMRESQAPG